MNCVLYKVLNSMLPIFWPKGVKQEKEQHGAYEFILNGSPWIVGYNKEELVEARVLLNNLFAFFSQNNWSFYGAAILTMSIKDKSTFFFRYSDKTKHFKAVCLSPHENDKIRFIGDNQKAIEVIRNSIKNCWSKGIQSEQLYYGSQEYKLNGEPFKGHDSNHLYACYMMMTILRNLESIGLKLIASADVSGDYNVKIRHTNTCSTTGGNTTTTSYDPIDLDSWFFYDSI